MKFSLKGLQYLRKLPQPPSQTTIYTNYESLSPLNLSTYLAPNLEFNQFKLFKIEWIS